MPIKFKKTKTALMIIVALLPLLAMAVDAPPPDVVRSHPDLFSWFLGGAIAVIVAMLARYIHNADVNNQKQWAAIDAITRDVGILTSQHNRLMGEHEALKVMHCSRSRLRDDED